MSPEGVKSDDEHWVDELAGRRDPRTAAGTKLEAGALREALKAHEARTARAPEALPADLSREGELLARARAEGLLGMPDAAAAPSPTPRSTPRWLPWLAAAAVAGLAIGLGLQMRSTLPPDALPVIERAGPLTPFRLAAEDPAALKQQILAELRAAGVEARGYEALGAQGIDADLPRPLTDAVRRVLQTHGIPVPEDGVLLLEIVERETPGSAP